MSPVGAGQEARPAGRARNPRAVGPAERLASGCGRCSHAHVNGTWRTQRHGPPPPCLSPRFPKCDNVSGCCERDRKSPGVWATQASPSSLEVRREARPPGVTSQAPRGGVVSDRRESGVLCGRGFSQSVFQVR